MLLVSHHLVCVRVAVSVLGAGSAVLGGKEIIAGKLLFWCSAMASLWNYTSMRSLLLTILTLGRFGWASQSRVYLNFQILRALDQPDLSSCTTRMHPGFPYQSLQ